MREGSLHSLMIKPKSVIKFVAFGCECSQVFLMKSLLISFQLKLEGWRGFRWVQSPLSVWDMALMKPCPWRAGLGCRERAGITSQGFSALPLPEPHGFLSLNFTVSPGGKPSSIGIFQRMCPWGSLILKLTHTQPSLFIKITVYVFLPVYGSSGLSSSRLSFFVFLP